MTGAYDYGHIKLYDVSIIAGHTAESKIEN